MRCFMLSQFYFIRKYGTANMAAVPDAKKIISFHCLYSGGNSLSKKMLIEMVIGEYQYSAKKCVGACLTNAKATPLGEKFR